MQRDRLLASTRTGLLRLVASSSVDMDNTYLTSNQSLCLSRFTIEHDLPLPLGNDSSSPPALSLSRPPMNHMSRTKWNSRYMALLRFPSFVVLSSSERKTPRALAKSFHGTPHIFSGFSQAPIRTGDHMASSYSLNFSLPFALPYADDN